MSEETLRPHKDFTALLKELGITPHSLMLYEMAFTHSSCNGMNRVVHEDYERLEFLGDSVIGLVVADLCYSSHPEMEQGELSMLKAQFIRTDSEAHYALALHLDDYIRLGTSFLIPIKEASHVLEDVFESFIGAVYLDQGRDFTYSFVRNIFEKDIESAEVLEESNPKSNLQEAMQAEKKEAVSYKTIAEEGPAHARSYTCAVYFEGSELGRGTGSSKQVAEVEAAKEALKHLSLGLDQEIYTSAEMAETAIEGYDEDFGTKRKH
jgi:ribonuclease-3